MMRTEVVIVTESMENLASDGNALDYSSGMNIHISEDSVKHAFQISTYSHPVSTGN